MEEVVECYLCEAMTNSLEQAETQGWTEIELDPAGRGFTFLGLCPDCRREEESSCPTNKGE
jgi:hypothetical protein